MGKADLHAHSCHDAWGDGNQGIEELFRYVEEETDLDLFAITDHDSTDAARAAQERHRRERYRFGFLPGVEVTNQRGHLLCYFPSGEIVDIPSLRPFRWTVEYAHRHGAICVAAHPVYPPWLGSALLRAREVQGETDEGYPDGVEVVNGAMSEKAQGRLDGLAAELAPYTALVGNSDAHDRAAIGSVYTRFPGHTVEDFLRALRDRRTEPVFVRRPKMDRAAQAFTTRRSMTRPGWVRNLWREVRG